MTIYLVIQQKTKSVWGPPLWQNQHGQTVERCRRRAFRGPARSAPAEDGAPMKRFPGQAPPNVLAAITAAVVVCAIALTGGGFIDPCNLQPMAGQVPELGLLAIGVMLAMIAGNGGIDLSGIALANLAGVCAGVLLPHWVDAGQTPLLFTLALVGVALAVGLLGGLLNGLLIACAGLTPTLCTLGTQLVFAGLAVVLSGGSAVRIGLIEPLDFIGNGLVLGLPLCFMLFVGIALAIGVWLRHSPFGMRLFLMGTNPKAARYAGVPQRRMLLSVYTLCGLLASVSGIVIAARSSSVKWDYGSSYVLIAILIAVMAGLMGVMAGVRPEGGHGRMLCLLLSATALQFLSSTFNFLEVSSFFRDCAWGLMLLLFVASSRFDARSLLPLRLRHAVAAQSPPAARFNSEGLAPARQGETAP